MKSHLTLFLPIFFVLFTAKAFGVGEIRLKCEGHTMFKKKVCEINVSVDSDAQQQSSDGNLNGTGKLKCYERNGTILNESTLQNFCYTGNANGTFLLEAQTEIKPFEVPSMKASVTIDISTNSKKMSGNANYYNGSVFKDMPLKCEYIQ